MTSKAVKALLGPIYYRVRPLDPHPDPVIFTKKSDFERSIETKQIIVIASTPRSGSNLFGYMLREHGGFGYPLEYLTYVDRPYWAKRFGTSDIYRLMKHFLRTRTSEDGIFVNKVHWHQWEEYQDKVDEITLGLGVAKFVWIYRSRLLDQAVSWAIADQTNVWISGTKPERPAVYTYDEIVRFANYVEEENANWQKYLSNTFPDRSIVVDYDSLINPPNPTVDAVREFLKLKHDLVPSKRTKKQSGSVNQEWKTKFAADIRPDDRWILEPRHWSL